MKRLNLDEVRKFVEENIQSFHEARLQSLQSTKLNGLLGEKNPYLFRAKNILNAQELVVSFLDAKLSSSEEKIFGDFLENLAIFVAKKTVNASKSSSASIDFEYTKENVRYLVTVKSGVNWGNSNQWKALESDFKNARKVLMQSRHTGEVKTVLGIAYGKAKTTLKRGQILQVTGQSFWYMISKDDTLYTKIIEPLGHKAKEMNDDFKIKRAQLVNKFTKEFTEKFCNKNGEILWERLVQYNSGNLTKEDKDFL